MIGDQQDICRRLRAVLPTQWFADSTPVLDAVLSGFASGWSWIYDILQYVKAQTRIATASESLTRISKGTSQSSREQHDGSGIEEGGCRGDRSFEILCEAAVSPEPCQEAFDHPTPGMDGEANLTGLLADNLDDDPGRVRHPFAGIGAIGENPLDERQQCT